jgi:hypothetical protein
MIVLVVGVFIVVFVIVALAFHQLPRVADAGAKIAPVVAVGLVSTNQSEPVVSEPWSEEENLNLTTNEGREVKEVSVTERELNQFGLSLKNMFSVSVKK